MNTWRLLAAVFVVLACAAVKCSIVRGPRNRIGIHHDNVTLRCRSERAQPVKWTFTQFGKTAAVDETKFPGHHVTSSSTRGFHSLTLESVTFQHAGKYVCRVIGSHGAGGLDAAAAYVVVVADPPRCSGNVTDGWMSMECSVVFISEEQNLTLEWIAPDGRVLRRRRYRSDNMVPSVGRLRIRVTAQTSTYNQSMPAAYKCRAYFGNRTARFADEASNAPEFRRNTCTVPVPASTVSPTDASAYEQPSSTLDASNTPEFRRNPCITVPQPASTVSPNNASGYQQPSSTSSDTNPMLIVVLAVSVTALVLMIATALLCLYLFRRKLKSTSGRDRRHPDGGQTEDQDNCSNATDSLPLTEVGRSERSDSKKSGDVLETEGNVPQVAAEPDSLGEQSSDESQQRLLPFSTTATNNTSIVAQQPSNSTTNAGIVCPGGNRLRVEVHPEPQPNRPFCEPVMIDLRESHTQARTVNDEHSTDDEDELDRSCL